VKNTADIGPAVIVSESSIGSGLRRIDLVAGEAADALVRRDRELVADLARSFNVTPDELPERVEALRAQLKDAQRERERLRRERIGGDGMSVKHGRVDYVTQAVDATNVDELKSFADRYLERVKSGIVTLVAGDKFVIKVSKDLTSQYDANRLKAFFGGKGGGPAHLVTGTLTVPADEAFSKLDAELAG
jgi:alanyl-tRNA synthetase